MSRPKTFLPSSFSACAMTACMVAMWVGIANPAVAQMACKEMGAMGQAAPAKPPAPASTSLALTVDGKTTTLTPADLKAMPQKTVKVHNEHTKMDESYSGVPLGDLLAKAGFVVSTTTHRTMLRSYIQAEGTDKYWVLYSVTEVEGSEHEGDVIVATSMDGKGLGADGELKLVSTGDKKPQRWVRNLAAITMKNLD